MKHIVHTTKLEGVQVIEASAGTGKTWTLSGLYLRLLLEQWATVDQILAITFTIAAAAELRDRIRRRLREMLDALEGGAPADPFIEWMLPRITDPARAKRHLWLALCSFDEARIHTIHGYCQRALAEHAFGSGVPFECEVIADTSALLHEVAADFWRRTGASSAAAGSDPENQRLLVAWLDEAGAGIEKLEELGLRYARREGLEVRPPRLAALPPLLDDFRAAHARCRAAWENQGADVIALLKTSAALGRNAYRVASIDKWRVELEGFLQAPSLALPKTFAKFTTACITEGTKAKQRPPAHPFFAFADALCAAHAAADAALAAHWANLRLEFLAYARAELAQRLAGRDLQSFDDLLLKLSNALAAPRGGRLAESLRRRCPYALIDEFQDTDPLQWRIFHSIYKDAPADRHAAFLVGDPKQAIYAFRGADVYAYLAAVDECGTPLPLRENQRSVPGLVAGLNAVFGASGDPFRSGQIRYAAVAPAKRSKPALVEQGQADAAPLRIAFAGSGGDGKPLTKEQGRDWAAWLAADEIVRLVGEGAAGRIRLGDRSLRAGDIAVLVNNRFQAAQVRAMLAARGVASAELSTESVFATGEAEQLQRLLVALAAPKDAAAVRTALVTDLIGFDAPRIAALQRDEALWEAELADFEKWQGLWREHGVMRALREVFRARHVAQNLARYRDGERRLTNLSHLCELLNLEEQRLHGHEALVSWLAGRRAAIVPEDVQLRLESDAGLVQIVTIHRSKGLEYPVTFVPFLWDAGRAVGNDGLVAVHEAAPPHRLVLDAVDPDAQLPRARDESLGERVRIAYVALTRAINRCYVFTGALRDNERSALGWLLHGVADPEGNDATLPPADVLHRQLEELRQRAPESIQLWQPGPLQKAMKLAEGGVPQLAARRLAQPVQQGFAMTSFSALLRSAERYDPDPVPDHDQGAAAFPAPPAAPPGGGRFAFPRGSAAGNCLHAIYEHADFAEADWQAAITPQLARAGHPAAWAGELQQWLQETVHTPLPGRGDETFTLAGVARAAQLRELPFHLATPEFATREFVATARRHGFPVSDLPPETLRGYLTGYMDLAFRHGERWYVADYKSNWLGPEPEAYGADALAAAMADGDYHLQYLIYTVALHRWLRASVPGYEYERHFGGVRYLFLRGMHPDWRDLGVYCARPDVALVEALDACLGRPVTQQAAA